MSTAAEGNIRQRVDTLMQRVLIVAPRPSVAMPLCDLLRGVGRCQIWTAAGQIRGLEVAKTIEPHLIFVEHDDELEGVGFTCALRRSHLAARKAVVIMVSAQATAAAMISARDAGAHEFLRRPYTINDLTRRLDAVARRPREWIEGIDYVGPDRRRFNAGDYAGPLRRRVDHAKTPDEARIGQALRNLKAALAALERDPRQALRSMQAQTDDLGRIALTNSDLAFRAAVAALFEGVMRCDVDTLNQPEVERLAARLLAALPPEQSQLAAAPSHGGERGRLTVRGG